jgi:hypothetical protein
VAGLQIRWRSLGRAGAIAAAAIAGILSLPALLGGDRPPPVPADVGLAPVQEAPPATATPVTKMAATPDRRASQGRHSRQGGEHPHLRRERSHPRLERSHPRKQPRPRRVQPHPAADDSPSHPAPSVPPPSPPASSPAYSYVPPPSPGEFRIER